MAEMKAEACGGRPFGFAETTDQLFITKYSAGVYWQVGVIESSEPLQEHHLKKVLTILAHRQEALQMRVVCQDPKNQSVFSFAPMDNPVEPDFEIVSVKSKGDWPDIIARDHITNKIDHENGPLWRVILCREADETRDHESYEYIILFKISHVIADGKSMTDLMYHQLLPLLSESVNGHNAEESFPFVPQIKCVEELFLSKRRFENPVPWYFKAGLSILRWKNRTFKPPEAPVLMFPGDNLPTDMGQVEPACIPKIFGQEICEPVIKAAKDNGVTVHSVLLVAGAMALSRTCEAAGVKLPKTFEQAWPIDLRRFLDFTTPQPLGDIRSGSSTMHENITACTLDNFWITCRKIFTSVKAGSSKEKCTQFLGLAKYLADEISKSDFDTVLKEIGMRPYISLSNLGNVSAGPKPSMYEGPVKIRMKEQFFTLSGVAPMTFVPVVQLVLTFEGRFMWNVIHSPTKVSRRFVDTYYENLADILETYCVQK